MTQPYRGRTVVVITHPTQDISWRSPTNLAEVTAAVERGINAGAAGIYADTTVYVEQGGTQAYATATLSGVGGTAASGAFTFSSASGTTTATLNGKDFSQTTGTDAARGVALSTAINASTDPLVLGLFTASDDGSGVVTVTAVHKGTSGNSYALAVSGTGLARSAATLENGANGSVTLTIAGRAVVTNTTDLTDAAAATAIAASINADAVAPDYVTGSASGDVVTVTANEYAPSGNLITITQSTTTGAVTLGNTSGGKLQSGAYPTGNYLRRP